MFHYLQSLQHLVVVNYSLQPVALFLDLSSVASWACLHNGSKAEIHLVACQGFDFDEGLIVLLFWVHSKSVLYNPQMNLFKELVIGCNVHALEFILEWCKH